MGVDTTPHVGVDEIFKGIHNSGGGGNVLREAWSRAVSFVQWPNEIAQPKLRQMALHGRGQYFWGAGRSVVTTPARGICRPSKLHVVG